MADSRKGPWACKVLPISKPEEPRASSPVQEVVLTREPGRMNVDTSVWGVNLKRVSGAEHLAVGRVRNGGTAGGVEEAPFMVLPFPA